MEGSGRLAVARRVQFTAAHETPGPQPPELHRANTSGWGADTSARGAESTGTLMLTGLPTPCLVLKNDVVKRLRFVCSDAHATLFLHAVTTTKARA